MRFTSYSPVGYASESITLLQDGLKLIEDMEQDDYEQEARDELARDKARFEAALKLMYEVLQDVPLRKTA